MKEDKPFIVKLICSILAYPFLLLATICISVYTIVVAPFYQLYQYLRKKDNFILEQEEQNGEGRI